MAPSSLGSASPHSSATSLAHLRCSPGSTRQSLASSCSSSNTRRAHLSDSCEHGARGGPQEGGGGSGNLLPSLHPFLTQALLHRQPSILQRQH